MHNSRPDSSGSSPLSLKACLPGLAVFLVAFAVRLAYVLELGSTPLMDCLTVDLKYYHDWALQILGGDIVGGEVFEMSPLYPYLVALFYKIFSADLFSLRIAQIIVGSLSCVLVYKIAREIGVGTALGVVAGLAYALYGPAIFYDAMVMKSFLTVFFALFLTHCLLKSRGGGGVLYPLGAGISLGLAALVRENIIILAPLIPFFFILARGQEKRALAVALFVVGLLVTIAPVTARNYFVGGEMVLITSGGGEVFYISNNAEADGTYRPPDFVRPTPRFEHEDFRQKAEELSGRELTRKESSDFWFAEGKKFIFSNPVAFASLTARRFVLFWNYYEYPDNQNYYFMRINSTLLGAPLLHYGVIAPLGFVGLLLSLAHIRRMLPLLLVFIPYMAGMLLLFNFSRFRLAAAPLLVVFGVYFLWWVRERTREKGYKSIAIAALPFIIWIYLANHNAAGSDPYRHKFDVAYTSLGICYGEDGNIEEARSSFESALEVNPRYPGALVGLGTAALRSGETALAEESYRKAIASEPDSPYAHFGLAEVLNLQRKRSEAIAHYRLALRVEPQNPSFLNGLGFSFAAEGRYDEAISTLSASIKSESRGPSAVDAHYGLALVFGATGAVERERVQLERFLSVSSEGDSRRAGAGSRLEVIK